MLLQVCILCAIISSTFCQPEGPEIQERYLIAHRYGAGGQYMPWMDGDRCVFRCYSLPLDRCVCTYGRTEVDSWPKQDPNVKIHKAPIKPEGLSIPGAVLAKRTDEDKPST